MTFNIRLVVRTLSIFLLIQHAGYAVSEKGKGIRYNCFYYNYNSGQGLHKKSKKITEHLIIQIDTDKNQANFIDCYDWVCDRGSRLRFKELNSGGRSFMKVSKTAVMKIWIDAKGETVSTSFDFNSGETEQAYGHCVSAVDDDLI